MSVVLEKITQIMGDAEGYGQLLVWRPNLQESTDSQPLVTNISDFLNFPYERLVETDYGFFLRPEVMVAMCLLYNLSIQPLRVYKDSIKFNPKGESFLRFVAMHNLALAVFSAVAAWNSWAVILSHLYEHGPFDTYCDVKGTHWQSGLGAWSIIFFLSKYAEFLDTHILVLKGKQPSFLQVYHHTGIVFCMWGGVVCQSAWLLFVVCLNSVIHTLMYSYFFIKTLYPKIQIESAKYLTMAQIGQLAFGISCSAGFHVMGDRCDTPASRLMLLCLLAYGASLVGLFVAFANKKYKKKRN